MLGDYKLNDNGIYINNTQLKNKCKPSLFNFIRHEIKHVEQIYNGLRVEKFTEESLDLITGVTNKSNIENLKILALSNKKEDILKLYIYGTSLSPKLEKTYFKEYEKTDEKKFSVDEIITLNFSLLKDLFDCPYKFKMTNVFGFCSPLNIRMGYGRSIHNMLDYIHRNYEKIDYNDPKIVERIVKKYLHLLFYSHII